MKILIKKGLIIWSIPILVISQAPAQDIQHTLELADRSLTEGRLNDAEYYYRRVLYFDTVSLYQKQVIEGLAVTSYSLKEYDDASGYFLSLSQLESSSEYYFYYILSLLKQHKYMMARRAALNVRDSTETMSISKNIFLALSAFGLREFESSKKYFETADQLAHRPLGHEAVFMKTSKIDKKNKMTAIALSAVIPGLGHAYSGHVKEGINSFVIISIFAGTYLYTAVTLGFADALISILPWFHRYYVGGLNSAALLVGHYKDEHLLEMYNELATRYGSEIR